MDKNTENLTIDENSNASATTSNSSSSDNGNSDDKSKRLNYLLRQTEVFAHFVTNSTKPKSPKKSQKRKKAAGKNRHRKNEEEEDAELMEQAEKEEKIVYTFDKNPSFIKNGEMRDYQIRGLNWMITLYENKINGILADEMGLGKTLQTISMFGYLRHIRNVNGPHLVVAPKSTLQNWLNEFNKWCPSIKALVHIGAKDDRKHFIQETLRKEKWDVVITSYEVVMLDAFVFRKIHWKYMVVDEAHRLKNEKNMISKLLRGFVTKNRLLLTGTPLQNNLHELWALLNYLLPDVFNSSDDFDSWFDISQLSEDTSIVKRLHSILKPFLLRRVKSDVEKSLLPKKELNIYVGLTKLQREWYTKILTHDISLLNGFGVMQKTRLQNTLMQLRKCTNHPYLFSGAEPEPFVNGEHLITNSGKLIVLDKLLPKLQAQGSRVLIFNQSVRMMDILEDYFFLRKYEYCRLDGQTAHEERTQQIDEFNAPNSKKFIFILSTRAGGLGINLATADYVIFYDSDWNPQVDLQAMDRAHRIGQKKQVHVLRLITESTIDEKVIERAEMKLRLDKIVIQQGRLNDKQAPLTKDDMLKIVQFGANKIFASKESDPILEYDIDTLLKIAEEKTAEQRAIFDKLEENQLKSLSLEPKSVNVFDFEGEDYRDKRLPTEGFQWIDLPKRDRRAANYYTKSAEPVPRPVKKVNKIPPPIINDFEFYPKRLVELVYQDYNYRRKEAELKKPYDEQDIEILAKANSDPLTEEEKKEEVQLYSQVFFDWNKRNLADFVKLLSKYGPDDTENIVNEGIDGKTAKEILAYREVFLERYTELQDADRIKAILIKQKEKIEKTILLKKILDSKVANCLSPFYDLKITYYGLKGKYYTEADDRFLVCTMQSIGIDTRNAYQELLEAVQSSNCHRFNWYLRSRTAVQLEKRCTTLFLCLEREHQDNEEKTKENVTKKKTQAKTGTGNNINNNKRKATTALTTTENENMEKRQKIL